MAGTDYEVELVEVELFNGNGKDRQIMTIESPTEWYLLNK